MKWEKNQPLEPSFLGAGWWQLKHLFIFSPKLGEVGSNFDELIFFKMSGLVEPPFLGAHFHLYILGESFKISHGFLGSKGAGKFSSKKGTPTPDVQRGDHMVNGSELVRMPVGGLWWVGGVRL